MQALLRPGRIDNAHLDALLVSPGDPKTPYLYFVNIGLQQKICSKRYQLIHQNVLCKYLPVVFQVEGHMRYGEATRGDALQVDDKGCGSPVTAKASIVVEPCSDNDLKWSHAVAVIRRMARAAAK